MKWRGLPWNRLAGGSLATALVVGVPLSVFSDSISQALGKEKPDWLYVVAATLAVLLATLTLVLITIWRSVVEAVSIRLPIEIRSPGSGRSLAQVLHDSTSELCFLGIVAKRSVNDDAFKRILSARSGSAFRMRFLLLSPESPTFAARALEEEESATSWALDQRATVERLNLYKGQFNLDIQVRLYTTYPLWRMIVSDSSEVYLNTFLPRKRGTESDQIYFTRELFEPGFGFIRMFDKMWELGVPV